MNFTKRQAWCDAALMVIGLGLLLLAVQTFGSNSASRVATNASILLVAVLGLQVFSGNSGIVSFGHAGFMAIGAYASGLLTMPASVQRTALKGLPEWLAGHELSIIVALGVVILLGLAVGFITSLPLLRLNGSSASIATLAMLIILFSLLVASREITRGAQPFYGVPREMTLWFAGIAAMLAIVIARLFRESAWGMGARAAGDDERGAMASGVSIKAARMVSWVLSAAMAAAAGAMMGHFLGAFSPKDFYFDLSFNLLAMLIVGGMGTVLGAFSGVLVVTLIGEVIRRFESGGEVFGLVFPQMFGLTQAALAIAMLLIIWRRPLGLLGKSEIRILERLGHKAQSAAIDRPAVKGSAQLEAKAVSRHYGGVKAVNDVSLTFETGIITGVIGPNGAGKTTFLNLLSGDVLPSHGEIVKDGKRLSGNSMHFARSGVARTFQNLRIFPSMSVLENVQLAAAQVTRDPRRAQAIALAELGFMQLEAFAHAPAGSLAYGQKRRLEIARALALQPQFLLLDEPAAGMNGSETEQLVGLLRQLRDERGLGIIVIEHDMGLVMSLCQKIAVIDHGALIAFDRPSEIQKNPRVIASYLGSKAADAMLSRQ